MIVAEEALPSLRAKHRKQKVIFTCGTFDLIHPGHLEFLEWCKAQGDVLVVSLNKDATVKREKGVNRPIIPVQDRLRMVDALRPVDYVTVKEGVGLLHEMSIQSATKLAPDVAVLGYDWADREIDYWRAALPSVNILVAPKRQKGRSTSAVIESIIKGFPLDT